MAFKYVKRNPDVVKTRSNQRGGDFVSLYKENVKIYKPRDGKNLIRILPPTWNNAPHFGHEVYINYGIGADEQAYFSLSKMKKEKDPLAEAKKQAEREGDNELAKSLEPTKRVLMYVIDRMAEEEGPQLYPTPWSLDKVFCTLSCDEDTGEIIMIDDPETGCDVRFYKEGKGLATKYPAEKIKILKPSPLSEDETIQEEWLEHVTEYPIPDVLNFYDYEHIAGVFDGQLVQPKATKPSTDEEEPVKSKSTRKPNVTTTSDVDDEEDEDDSQDEKIEETKTEEVQKMTASSIRERLAARKRST